MQLSKKGNNKPDTPQVGASRKAQIICEKSFAFEELRFFEHKFSIITFFFW